MRIGNRNFSPKFWPSLATLLLLPALIALGLWQLDRADQKRTYYEVLVKRQTKATININQDNARINSDEMLWRKVYAKGHFDEDVQILLDNQIMKNQVGYYVFTPFKLAEHDTWFLVNRGWVGVGNDRDQLPAFNRTKNLVSISGTAMNVPARGIRLGEIIDETPAPGVYRLQAIDIAHISKLTGIQFMPYIIRLNPDSQYGYARAWEMPDSGEDVHLAYAFQWFLLAITLLIIYIMVNLEKVQDSENI